MPYKSLCIQIRSRAWLGRQPWRQRVGLAFLMLHTRLPLASLLGMWALAPAPQQGQDPALCPRSQQADTRNRLDITHLDPHTLVMQGKDPNWDADPAGEAVTSPKDLQDPVVCFGRRGGVKISLPKSHREILLSHMWLNINSYFYEYKFIVIPLLWYILPSTPPKTTQNPGWRFLLPSPAWIWVCALFNTGDKHVPAPSPHRSTQV